MARPVIALLTDFGSRDHYVGVMKGVAIGICPEAALVDISHEIAPQDIVGGALELAASYRYFPAGTVFLVVVDPEVGSARRAVAASAGGRLFVGPDNGVLSLVFRQEAPEQLVELREARWALPTVSRTFEGRDRFAPAAAWLASGVALPALGPEIEGWCALPLAQAVVIHGRLVGEVVKVDRFGNLVTNIDREAVAKFGAGGIVVEVGERQVGPPVMTYAEASPDGLCALFGSTDHLEIAVNGGSAAVRLGLARGAVVRVRRSGEPPEPRS